MTIGWPPASNATWATQPASRIASRTARSVRPRSGWRRRRVRSVDESGGALGGKDGFSMPPILIRPADYAKGPVREILLVQMPTRWPLRFSPDDLARAAPGARRAAPVYRRIARLLTDEIRRGRLRAGERLAGDARPGAHAGREPQHGGHGLRRARRRRLDHHDAGLRHLRERAPARSVAAPVRRRLGAARGRPRGAGVRLAARAGAGGTAGVIARRRLRVRGRERDRVGDARAGQRRDVPVGRRARSDAGPDRGAGARLPAAPFAAAAAPRWATPTRRFPAPARRGGDACCRRRAAWPRAPTTC